MSQIHGSHGASKAGMSALCWVVTHMNVTVDRVRRVMFSLMLLCPAASGGGCASMHGRDDLDAALMLHHNNLRWGRLGNAALHVAPALRESFLQSWSARAPYVELQDMEVVGLTIAPDGNTAEVMVSIVYIERQTMRVRQVAATEVWRRLDNGWSLERPADLSDGTEEADANLTP